MTLLVDTETARARVHATPTRLVQKQEDKLPAYFYIAVISMVIPASFFIGDLYMTVSRMILFFVVPILLVNLINGKYGDITLVDKLFFFFLFWFSLSVVIQGNRSTITFIGSSIIIMLGGYLLGRCCVRGPNAFKQMIMLWGALVLASLPFAIYEFQTSIMPLARLVDQIPGVSGSPDVDYPSRNNLERVQFVFVHPIHYGIFCTYIFGLVVICFKHTLPLLARWGWGIAIALCCFTSGSSGPFLGILIVLLLIFYDVITKGRWKQLMWGSVGLYIILDILSDRPAYFAIIERLAFNPGTAYARRLMLDAGIDQIKRTPIFGTPGRPATLPHWLPASMDNYWLATGMSFGMPALIALAAAFIVALMRAGRADVSHDPKLTAMRKGWVIAVIASCFSLATVYVWAEMASLTYVFFAGGLWLMTAGIAKDGGDPDAALPDDASADADKRQMRYSRFPIKSRVSTP